MSRPKGSKNKKTLLSEAQLEDRIASQRAEVEKKAAQEQAVIADIETLKTELKAKRKERRSAEKALAQLLEKKAQAAAIADAAAKKKEIEKVVASLVSSGKSAEEILGLLKK